jgi:hypothetical protein
VPQAARLRRRFQDSHGRSRRVFVQRGLTKRSREAPLNGSPPNLSQLCLSLGSCHGGRRLLKSHRERH